jgi:nucleotide-binding universal stress UspA family protein
MFRSILVPLDGSTFGEHALPFALSIARRAGARLELVHVHEPLTIPDLPLPVLETEDREARQRACDYLDDAVRRLSALSPGEVIRSLRLGPAADRLCEFVAEEGIDLVVMATHGRGPLSRFWLGSVADELVRRMPAPLLLVRPQEGPPDLASEPVLRRILIPLDGSPFAEQILEPAVALGALLQADYRLLRVVPPVLIGGFDTPGARRTGTGGSIAELLETEARTYLKGVGERLQGQLSTVQMRVTLAWPPAVTILDDAQTHSIDLIALATHGRSGLARLLLGSVADKVLRGASVPVLLQRPVGS